MQSAYTPPFARPGQVRKKAAQAPPSIALRCWWTDLTTWAERVRLTTHVVVRRAIYNDLQAVPRGAKKRRVVPREPTRRSK